MNKTINIKELTVQRLRINELDGFMPLTMFDYNCYQETQITWYKVNSEAEFELIKEYCLETVDDFNYGVTSYPATICIVDNDGDYFDIYVLETIMEQTKEFFKYFNINVDFNK